MPALLACDYIFSQTILYLSVLTLQEPLRFVLAAGTGTLFLVSLIVLRIYLVYLHLVLASCHFNVRVPQY